MNMLEIKENSDYIPALDSWYYTIEWKDLPEFSGILDYVNRQVEITIDGRTRTALVVDRPLPIKN